MLAAVVRGGAQYSKRPGGLFGRIKNYSSGKSSRSALSFDEAGKLISAAKSYRDKTLYSFLAASGCRQHEALQIRIDDIDFKQRRVKLVNPFSRKIIGLSQSEYSMLAWKGRATEETFLIEPFKMLFFEYLEHYFRHERIAHGLHDFIFQKRCGRPYW